MKKTIKKSLAIIFAALLTTATAAMLTGCGGDNKESSNAATTVAATTAAQTTVSGGQSSDANQNQDNQNSQSAENNGSENNGSQSNDGKVVDSEGYIDEQTAIANVKQQAGSGATIISSTKGYDPDGLKAWVIVVQPVTNNDSTDTVTYYSGYQFCYAVTSSENNGNNDSDSPVDSDGYIDEQTAIANVKQQAGSGATIISSEKGYSPDGLKAWVIVVQPVTNTDSTDTVTYYSGYQFCYSEDRA